VAIVLMTHGFDELILGWAYTPEGIIGQQRSKGILRENQEKPEW
jgi:hypothetical protein